MSDLLRNPVVTKYKSLGWLVIKLQSLGVILTSMVAIIWGWPYSVSIILGGAVAVLPNALFMLWLFARVKPSDLPRMLRSFYLGELFKLMAMAAGLIVLFKWIAIIPGAALFGFFIALVFYWVTPMITKGR